jgi:hypothetical protein
MAGIEKGIVLTIEGPADKNGDKTKARVQPQGKTALVSRPLTIPWWLRGKMGDITKGTEVAFVLFDDQTGIILSRMDGNWNGIIPGIISVSDISTPGVKSFNTHVHGGVEAGPDKTSGPE